jgi:hypothetical protein
MLVHIVVLPRFRRLVADLLVWRIGFNSQPGRVEFVVGEVLLGQYFLQVLRLSLSVTFQRCSLLILWSIPEAV